MSESSAELKNFPQNLIDSKKAKIDALQTEAAKLFREWSRGGIGTARYREFSRELRQEIEILEGKRK